MNPGLYGHGLVTVERMDFTGTLASLSKSSRLKIFQAQCEKCCILGNICEGGIVIFRYVHLCKFVVRIEIPSF